MTGRRVIGALTAARAVQMKDVASGDASGRLRELVAATLPVKGACGVAARPDVVRPWTASLGGPAAPTARWRRHGTSTHGPGSDRGVPDGGSGPVGRPGPAPSTTSAMSLLAATSCEKVSVPISPSSVSDERNSSRDGWRVEVAIKG